MTPNKLQKLELTWIGKGEEPKLEPRILIEQPDYSYRHNSQNRRLSGLTDSTDVEKISEIQKSVSISDSDIYLQFRQYLQYDPK